MSDLRQYQLARLCSHAWPKGQYRLVRIHSSDADAPAAFQVCKGAGKLGKLTVSREGVFYGGYPTKELSAAVNAVQAALAAQSGGDA